MRFTLTAKQNHETGELGWLDSRIRGSDIFKPLAYPLGLAHDCLEHTAFESVADEIEANGAMYRIRYEGGYSKQYGSSLRIEDFAAEWINLVNGLAQEPYLPNPPRTHALDASVESDLDDIIDQGRAIVRKEFAGEYKADIERLSNVFRAYFRRGYRKVAKRFKGLNSCEISYLFTMLEKAFERQKTQFEGEQIRVTVNLRTQSVRIDDIYMDDE